VHARVQTKVGDQTVGAGEPRHGSDRGDQPDRDHHVDARDRHQPLHVRFGQPVAPQLALDDLQILAEAVVLAQVPGAASPSSGGSGWATSHARPRGPNRSA
jgi:hypothetical protein